MNRWDALKALVDREEVRSAVRARMLALEGVEALVFLDQGLRQEIEALERRAEENGALGGLMPFVNTGVWEVLSRSEVFIIVVQSRVEIIRPEQQQVRIIDQRGNIIGEYVPGGWGEDADHRENSYMIGDNFIMYGDVEIVGEPYFVIPPMPFPPLEDMPDIKGLVSAGISTLSDEHVRSRLGYGDTKCWTHMVGYDL